MCLVHRVSMAAERRKPIPVSEVSLSSCVTLPSPLASTCASTAAAALISHSASGLTANTCGLLPCVSFVVYVHVWRYLTFYLYLRGGQHYSWPAPRPNTCDVFFPLIRCIILIFAVNSSSVQNSLPVELHSQDIYIDVFSKCPKMYLFYWLLHCQCSVFDGLWNLCCINVINNNNNNSIQAVVSCQKVHFLPSWLQSL